MAQTYACSPKVVGGPDVAGHSPAAVPGRGDPSARSWRTSGSTTSTSTSWSRRRPRRSPRSRGSSSSCFARRPTQVEVWFRRPQSVYRVARSSGRLEFLYKVVGRGTQGLATLEPGDTLDMVGPLGRGLHARSGVEEHRGARPRRRPRDHGADLADRRRNGRARDGDPQRAQPGPGARRRSLRERRHGHQGARHRRHQLGRERRSASCVG